MKKISKHKKGAKHTKHTRRQLLVFAPRFWGRGGALLQIYFSECNAIQ